MISLLLSSIFSTGLPAFGLPRGKTASYLRNGCPLGLKPFVPRVWSMANSRSSWVTWLRYHSAWAGWTFIAPNMPAETWAPSFGWLNPPNAAPMLLRRNVPSSVALTVYVMLAVSLGGIVPLLFVPAYEPSSMMVLTTIIPAMCTE